MTMRTSRTVVFALLLTPLLVTIAGGASLAQSPATTPGGLSEPVKRYSLDDLLFLRSEDAIRADLEAFRQSESQVDLMLTSARERQRIAESSLDIKQSEIDTLKMRQKESKKAKDAAASAGLTTSLEAQKKQLEILSAIVEVAEQQEAVAKSWKDSIVAGRRTFEAELALVKARERRTAGGTSFDLEAWKGFQEFHEASLLYASRMAEASAALKKLGKKREKILEQWKPAKR